MEPECELEKIDVHFAESNFSQALIATRTLDIIPRFLRC